MENVYSLLRKASVAFLLSLCLTATSWAQSLTLNILSYDCNSGVFQYEFSSGDNSPVTVSIPGLFAGTTNPNTVITYTFPSDGRSNRMVSGSASQSGNSISFTFTNGCNMPTNPPGNPPTNPPYTPSIPVPTSPNLPKATPNQVGNLEQVNCNLIQGWVLDQNNPNQSTTFDVYVNGQLAASNVPANKPRPDVAIQYGIPSYNAFGFALALPDQYHAGASLTILVKFSGTSTNIANCPQTTAVCAGDGSGANGIVTTNCGLERIFPRSASAFSSVTNRPGITSLRLSADNHGSTSALTSKLIPIKRGKDFSFSTYVFTQASPKSNINSQIVTSLMGGVTAGGILVDSKGSAVDQRRPLSQPVIGLTTVMVLPWTRSIFSNLIPNATAEVAFYNKDGRYLHRQFVNINKNESGTWQFLHLQGRASEDGYVSIRLKNTSKSAAWFSDVEFSTTVPPLVELEHKQAIAFNKSRNGFAAQLSIDKSSVYEGTNEDPCTIYGGWLDVDVNIRAPRYIPVETTPGPPGQSGSDNPNPPPGYASPLNGSPSTSNGGSGGITIKIVGRDKVDEQNDFRKFPEDCQAISYLFDRAASVGKEVGAYITDKGIIILPDRFATVNSDGSYGFLFGNATDVYPDPQGGYYIMTSEGNAHISGMIHTHPYHSNIPSATPSDADFILADKYGPTVAQYIMTGTYMNYFEFGRKDGNIIQTYGKTVYNAETGGCATGTPKN